MWAERDIAGYLFAGGLAGASSILAAGADLTGRPRLARRAKLCATAAIGVSLAALIHDLGRPARFLNMLRVFKPTSPMSVGVWILSAYAPLNGASAASELTGDRAAHGAGGRRRRRPAGAGVASYTAALIADTAVPAWHEGHRELPFLFAGSAASAAGGVRAAGRAAARERAGATARRARRRGRAGRRAAAGAAPRDGRRDAARPGPRAGACGRRRCCRWPARSAPRSGAPRSRFAAALSGGGAAGGLGADPVRHLRRGHGVGARPEVHRRAPAGPTRAAPAAFRIALSSTAPVTFPQAGYMVNKMRGTDQTLMALTAPVRAERVGGGEGEAQSAGRTGVDPGRRDAGGQRTGQQRRRAFGLAGRTTTWRSARPATPGGSRSAFVTRGSRVATPGRRRHPSSGSAGGDCASSRRSANAGARSVGTDTAYGRRSTCRGQVGRSCKQSDQDLAKTHYSVDRSTEIRHNTRVGGVARRMRGCASAGSRLSPRRGRDPRRCALTSPTLAACSRGCAARRRPRPGA